MDAFNPNIYPGDDYAEKFIKYNIPVTRRDTDATFIAKLKEAIPQAVEAFQPEFIIYNTDAIAVACRSAAYPRVCSATV